MMEQRLILPLLLFCGAYAAPNHLRAGDAHAGVHHAARRLADTAPSPWSDGRHGCSGSGPCVIEAGMTVVVDQNVDVESLTVRGTLRTYRQNHLATREIVRILYCRNR